MQEKFLYVGSYCRDPSSTGIYGFRYQPDGTPVCEVSQKGIVNPSFLAINKKALADTDIILPPFNLQKAFADFVRQADKSKVIAMNAAEKLRLGV